MSDEAPTTTITPGINRESRSPFPVPFGWFQVGWSGDIAPGEAKPLRYFEQHLVLWRGDDGVAHVQTAFCPHLGAHLGHGGRVTGCEIACPFHGWRFDADGKNTLIPYSSRTNAKGRLFSFPVVERNGLIFAWYHPARTEPEWEIPEVDEFNDHEDFTDTETRTFTVRAPWQDLAENGVDSAHFRYVHNTEQVPELEGYDVDGWFAKMRSRQKFPTPQGVVDGRIDVDNFGPGFSVIRFSGIVDTILMGCNTPVDANCCEMRFTFTVRKLGDDALNSAVGAAFVQEIHNQVVQDTPVWENKAFLHRPALADNDGPFTKFRKWASQFYFEGVATDASEYWPQDSYPADPDAAQTASQRHGSDWMDT